MMVRSLHMSCNMVRHLLVHQPRNCTPHKQFHSSLLLLNIHSKLSSFPIVVLLNYICSQLMHMMVNFCSSCQLILLWPFHSFLWFLRIYLYQLMADYYQSNSGRSFLIWFCFIALCNQSIFLLSISLLQTLLVTGGPCMASYRAKEWQRYDGL